jgi:FKBP-type peptidyl-prolyl cis-trans isomerase 2
MLARYEGGCANMRHGTAALAMAIVAMLVLSSGCLSGDDEPEVKIELTLMGEEIQNVVQGNNTSFQFVIENNWKEEATLKMSLAKTPADWTVEFLPQEIALSKHTGTGVRMNVSVPPDARSQGHSLKVWVKAQGSDTHEKSLTVTVFPLDSTISHDRAVVTPGGDTTYANYTGYLLNGQVFDTTNEDIALAESIEKAPSFQPRNVYDPQPFHPGTGELVDGFETGWTNMRKGEYKAFYVSEFDAYSRYDEFTFNLTETIDMQEEWKSSEFERAFRQEPAMWLVVTHRKYNWTAQVVNIADDETNTVTLELQTSPGENTTTYGWESVVESVDSTANGGIGQIVLRHHPGEVGSRAQVYNSTAPVEYDFGEVIEVTDTTVTVLIQTSHHDLAGEDLIFWVKIHDFQA